MSDRAVAGQIYDSDISEALNLMGIVSGKIKGGFNLQTKTTTTWTNNIKNTTTYTQETKNTTTYTNQTKNKTKIRLE